MYTVLCKDNIFFFSSLKLERSSKGSKSSMIFAKKKKGFISAEDTFYKQSSKQKLNSNE